MMIQLSLVLPCSLQTVPGHRVSNHHRTEVHLRIYHRMEATSYLSDAVKMHHFRGMARNSWCSVGSAVGADGLPQPTGETQPPPDQRLPPRETRPERRRTPARPPPLHRQRNALEIEPGNATLNPLPTNADQDL